MRTHWNQKRKVEGTRVTFEIIARWKGTMFDVCGVGKENRLQVNRNVFLTHTHNDHLPLAQVLAQGITVRVASPLMSRMEKIYGNRIILEEYTDFLEAKHTFIANNKVTAAPAYAYFMQDAMLIPEADNAAEIIAQYKAKYVFCFAFKQPRGHFGNQFDNKRNDVFILDNSVWNPYAPNIIPKITYAITDEEAYLKRLRQPPLAVRYL